MDILNVRHVSKNYSGHNALTDVSFDVKQGCVYGLLGPNGAGKTTLIRIINHITAPDSGEVIFNGHRLCQQDVTNIGYLPEERGLYKKMKVGEQAVFFARLKGMSKADATRELKSWFNKFDIMPWWNKKVEELSKGMAQKVQFIVTVLHRPQLLIFDEPFSGFDPINAKLLKDEILKLRDEGATIIFSTHNMSSVEALCNNITLINRSQNILTGNVEEIRRSHGANRYRFSFSGSLSALTERLTDEIDSVLESSTDEESGVSKAVIRFRPDTDRRALVSAVNDTVELHSFSDDLPSMDEIFIRSVEESNHRKNQEQ